MEKSYREQLEGLLQARSEDIRHGSRPRRGRQVTTAVLHAPAEADGVRSLEAGSGRMCDACGGEIGARRLRAMPHATLCLDCRRSAERAGTRS